MADRDSLEDLAIRLDVLETITMDIAAAICRMDIALRGEIIRELRATEQNFKDDAGAHPQKARMVQAFIEQILSP